MVLDITDHVRRNIDNNKLSVRLALDLSKAVSSICFSVMINKLKDKLKFSPPACHIIYSFLTDKNAIYIDNWDRLFTTSSLRTHIYSWGKEQNSKIFL